MAKRYEAYGWHVETVDWRGSAADGGAYIEDVDALLDAIERGKAGHRQADLHQAAAPSSRWPAPTKQNTGKSHGSALGDDEVAGHQGAAGLRPRADLRGRRRRPRPRPRGRDPRPADARRVAEALRRLARGQPRAAPPCWTGSPRRQLPEGLDKALPVFPADAKGVATRAASGKVLTALADTHARAVGRLGRPGRVQQHRPWRASSSFVPENRQTQEWKGGPYGRTLHFGIREHAMGMILNGIALEGLTRPYGGTFLVFSDYMRPAVRLAAHPAAARHLRVDARLDRPRRGRPDPPADRAPGRAARHPGPGRRPPG